MKKWINFLLSGLVNIAYKICDVAMDCFCFLLWLACGLFWFWPRKGFLIAMRAWNFVIEDHPS